MMVALTPARKNRRPLLWRFGELVFIFVLVGLMVWLTGAIQDIRRHIASNQLELEQQLEGAGAVAALTLAVDQRQGDLDNIFAHLTDQAGIGEVVAALEAEALRYDVALRIPVVEEVGLPDSEEANEDGEEPAPPDPLREVQLQLKVQGAPEQALRFFYAVEHLPYVLRTETWQLKLDQLSATPGATAAIPGRGPATGPLPIGAVDLGEPASLSELTLNLLLTVRNDSR